MQALVRPIFAYSNDARSCLVRVTAFWAGELRAPAKGMRGP